MSTGKFISQTGLYALAWTGVGLSGLFVTARMGIRYKLVHKFTDLVADDWWVLAAWIVLVVNAILQTLAAPDLFYLTDVRNGVIKVGPELFPKANHFVRYEFAIIGLFWTSLWCVKASFLSIYWRLFKDLYRWRLALWIVMVFTFLAYVGCWISSAYTCHPPSTYFDFGQCEKPIDMRGSTISIAYTTAVDVLTDVLIILLPMGLFLRLRVTWKAKAGLMVVFSLGIIIITVSIIRAVEINDQVRTDPVWLAVWSLVESTVSVIVGCLPPFKSLFKSMQSRASAGTPGVEGNGNSYPKRSKKDPNDLSTSQRSDFKRLESDTSGSAEAAGPWPSYRNTMSSDHELGHIGPIRPIEVRTDVWSTTEQATVPQDTLRTLGLRSVWMRDSDDSLQE